MEISTTRLGNQGGRAKKSTQKGNQGNFPQLGRGNEGTQHGNQFYQLRMRTPKSQPFWRIKRKRRTKRKGRIKKRSCNTGLNFLAVPTWGDRPCAKSVFSEVREDLFGSLSRICTDFHVSPFFSFFGLHLHAFSAAPPVILMETPRNSLLHNCTPGPFACTYKVCLAEKYSR